MVTFTASPKLNVLVGCGDSPLKSPPTWACLLCSQYHQGLLKHMHLPEARHAFQALWRGLECALNYPVCIIHLWRCKDCKNSSQVISADTARIEKCPTSRGEPRNFITFKLVIRPHNSYLYPTPAFSREICPDSCNIFLLCNLARFQLGEPNGMLGKLGSGLWIIKPLFLGYKRTWIFKEGAESVQLILSASTQISLKFQLKEYGSYNRSVQVWPRATWSSCHN